MKTVTTTIVCDSCGADLAEHDTLATLFRLCLSAEHRASTNPCTYPRDYEPPIAQPMHFCNKKCLVWWAAQAVA